MLAKTLKNMDGAGDPLISRPQRFDLYLTQTDFYGWRRHLPVSRVFHPDPVYERAHAHAMSFSSERGSLATDFGLTYATRTTAGFPVAFAAAGYSAVADAFAGARSDERPPSSAAFVSQHLREHQLAADGEYDPQYTWMIDGGILDNKPFELVAKAIENKPAARQVYRTVMYVEPEPNRYKVEAAFHPPRLKEVAGGLYRLFRHEPIDGDLRRHRDRNATVARIREIVDAARKDAKRAARKVGTVHGLAWKPVADELDAWRCATNDALRRQGDPAYPGYVALKARRSAGVLADMVCRALNYPEHSRHAYFVRELVRVWFGKNRRTAPPCFDEKCGVYRYHDGQRDLLDAFDLAFRRRRLRALVDAANRAYACADESRRQDLDDFKCRLAEASDCLDQVEEDGQQAVGHALKRLLCTHDVGGGIADLQNGCILDADYDCALKDTYDRVACMLRARCKDVNRDIVAAIQAIGHAAARQRIATDYVVFPFVDLVVFPLMDSAKVAELIEIDVMRVSPRDTQLLAGVGDPLHGDELGAFAGFLKRRWRENDLLWGRLNAVERLVDLIARAAVPDDRQYEREPVKRLRKRFKIKAMVAVLEDEARRPGTSIGRTCRCVRRMLAATSPSSTCGDRPSADRRSPISS